MLGDTAGETKERVERRRMASFVKCIAEGITHASRNVTICTEQLDARVFCADAVRKAVRSTTSSGVQFHLLVGPTYALGDRSVFTLPNVSVWAARESILHSYLVIDAEFVVFCGDGVLLAGRDVEVLEQGNLAALALLRLFGRGALAGTRVTSAPGSEDRDGAALQPPLAMAQC